MPKWIRAHILVIEGLTIKVRARMDGKIFASIIGVKDQHEVEVDFMKEAPRRNVESPPRTPEDDDSE